MEALEIAGRWWMPANPDTQIPGRLKFDNDNGGLLILDSTFQTAMLDMGDYPCLHGQLVDGRNITLYSSFTVQRHNGIEKIVVNTILIGGHLAAIDDQLYSSMDVEFRHFNAWLNRDGYSHDTELDEQRHPVRETTVFIFAPNIVINTENLQITVRNVHHTNMGIEPKISFKDKTFVVFRPQTPQTYHEMRRICGAFNDFIDFVMGKPTRAESITMTAVLNGEDIPCELAIRHDSAVSVPDDFPILDIVIRYGEIASELETIIRRWYSLYDQIRPTLQNYFSLTGRSGVFAEHIFLSLCQAIESYHRRMRSGLYLSQVDHDRVRSALTAAIFPGLDDGFVASLRSRIRYSNEFSLRRRLNDLYSQYHDILHPLGQHIHVSVSSIVISRNFQTHSEVDPNDAAENMLGGRMRNANEFLKLMLQCCFLSDIGLPVQRVSEVVTRSRMYQHLMRH